jgi:TATA-box binding protein (TBP) (component of TFIID and TFIIIB)
MSDMPKFEDIPVSTKTFIVRTNLIINIAKLFSFLPITQYHLIPKRRGRKKRVIAIDPNKDIPDGSIITIDLANNVRGVVLKKRRNREVSRESYFRNSVTVVMFIDHKRISLKVSCNGTIQATGIKQDRQIEDCVKYLWNMIKDNDEIYTLNESKFKAMFIPAMRNIDFNLGFVIDREKLGRYFNSTAEYRSLLEASVGYTGVNIKTTVKKQITDLKLKELTFGQTDWIKTEYVPYQNYLNTLKPKEQQKKIDKERFNTFLVFHSGKTIMSSMCEEFARDTYYQFLDIVLKNQDKFEEKLRV